jgi:hypothetical protein
VCIADAPICDAGGPYGSWCACPTEFDGTGSVAPGGVIVSYLWDFGDGSTGEGPIATHVYYTSYPWYLTATLTIIDDAAQTSVCSTRVHASCDLGILPPIESDAGGPYDGEVDEEIEFAGTAVVEESPTHTWDFGDGSSASGLVVTHAYREVGEYTVTFTVTDLMPYGCLEIGREEIETTSASVGANPVDRATWGAIKATFR